MSFVGKAEVIMKNTETLRNLINSGTFLHLPSVYDPLSARQVEQAGFEATYVGGYVSGATKAAAITTWASMHIA